MFFAKNFLENIEWFIENDPTIENVGFRDTFENVKNDDFESIVLDFPQSITLNFMLDKDNIVFEKRKIQGKQTLRSLFKIIFEFYQQEIPDEKMLLIFGNQSEIDFAIMERREYEDEDDNNGGEIKLKFIDGIMSEVPPDFVGLTQDESDPFLFHVDLGPI